MPSKGSRSPSHADGAGTPRRSPRTSASGGAKPRINVKELRKQRKAAAASSTPMLPDPLAPCDAAAEVRRAATGLVYDNMIGDWESKRSDAERLKAILNKCRQLGLVERCERLPAREASDTELLSCHGAGLAETLRQLRDQTDTDRLSGASNEPAPGHALRTAWRFVALAAGSAVDLTDRILDGKLQNGFVMLASPGHHAGPEDGGGGGGGGYCFSCSSLAARHAADRGNRVLVVDWDVHHCRDTQRLFYSDDTVLCFSIHRSDGDSLQPADSAGHWQHTGAGVGSGFNWNVPLASGASDADLLAVWHRLLLPAAYEFAPDLVIVSSGYGMTLGDPEGGMRVTPSCFAHLTHSLLALAGGRLLAVLEGGCLLPALAAAAAHTLAALLGDSPPPLAPSLPPTSDSVERTIRHVMSAHRCHWSFLSRYGTFSVLDAEQSSAPDCHWPLDTAVPPASQPDQPDGALTAADQLNKLLLVPAPVAPVHRVCLATSDDMLRHRNVSEPDHPERPERLSSIMTRLNDWGLTARCHCTPGRLRPDEHQLLQLHEPQHIADMADTAAQQQGQLDAAAEKYNSIFLCPDSYDCALLSAGCVIEAVDSVLSGESGSGLCVVRPPGHHAEPDTPHGFCLFNNVALAARHACVEHGLSRVLIIDWDIHHGNGIQHMFYEDRRVLYISLHRHDFGFFFPTSDDGDHDRVGSGDGRGFNVNVPWNRARMAGAEYVAALLAVVLPVAYQFAPELVLVSAGFDAARGDPLGGYGVPPEVYGHMTHHLAALAAGRLVVALEGGYNLTSIAYSMAMCARALLGDPPVQLPPMGAVNESAARTLQSVALSQRPFWPAVAEPCRLPVEQLEVVRRAAAGGEPLHRLVDQLSLAASAAHTDGRSQPADGGAADEAGQHGRSQPADGGAADEPGQHGRSQPADGGAADEAGQHGQQPPAAATAPRTASEAESGSGAGCPAPTAAGEGEAAAAAVEDGAVADSTSIRELLMLQEEMENMYAVIPLPSCPHLCTVADLPAVGINAAASCRECGDLQENWICLTCYQVLCGRYRASHMLAHGAASGHCMVLSLADLSVWCYVCEAYVHHETLIAAKRAAHRSKFGVDMPGGDAASV